VFIDPCHENPRRHITFRGNLALPVNNSRRGRASIDALGLNREELKKYRAKHYEIARTLVEITRTSKDHVKRRRARKLIDSYLQEHSEYSSMFLAAKRDRFRYSVS